jgi:hypothetical protein
MIASLIYLVIYIIVVGLILSQNRSISDVGGATNGVGNWRRRWIGCGDAHHEPTHMPAPNSVAPSSMPKIAQIAGCDIAIANLPDWPPGGRPFLFDRLRRSRSRHRLRFCRQLQRHAVTIRAARPAPRWPASYDDDVPARHQMNHRVALRRREQRRCERQLVEERLHRHLPLSATWPTE